MKPVELIIFLFTYFKIKQRNPQPLGPESHGFLVLVLNGAWLHWHWRRVWDETAGVRAAEPLIILESGCGGEEWPRLQGYTERAYMEDSVGKVKSEFWSCSGAHWRGW